MANYRIVPMFFGGARRKVWCGYDVATDYWAGVMWIVGIPSLVLLFIFAVILSGEMTLIFSYSTLLLCVMAAIVLTAAIVVSLVVLLTSDPGVVLPGTTPVLSHRCPVCRWDVNEFDHHCPIVGACIGMGTMRYFITFNAITTLLCLLVFTLSLSLCLHASKPQAVLSSLWRTPGKFVPLFFATYTATKTRVLAIAFLIAAVYGGLMCLLLAVVHVAFSLTGKFSVERRRHTQANPGISYVFANYFHPQLARRAHQLLSTEPV